MFNDVFFNAEWIYHKICAFDLTSMLSDLEMYKENKEVNVLKDALKMAESGKIDILKIFFPEFKFMNSNFLIQ